MANPFLVLRFIFLALDVYLNLLALVFAAWNIGSVKAVGLPAPGSSIFILVNSILVFIMVVIAMLEMFKPNSGTARVGYECMWTAVLSMLSLAAAIDCTVTGPPVYCQSKAPYGACASSFLMVPVSWFTSTATLLYFLALLVSAMSHRDRYPAVWALSVYVVPWFQQEVQDDVPPSKLLEPKPAETKTDRPSLHSKNSNESFSLMRAVYSRWSRIGQDTENAGTPRNGPQIWNRKSTNQQPHRPQWATAQPTRRGLDTPFARHPQQGFPADLPPEVPQKTRANRAPSSYRRAHESFDPFPYYADADRPIQKPRSQSDWMSADQHSISGYTGTVVPTPTW